jgi:hypothetical protein
MTPEAKARRRQKDHERYMRNHDERLANQRVYYREHPEYHKRKAREWEKKKREEIIYERREQNTTAGSDGPATTEA